MSNSVFLKGGQDTMHCFVRLNVVTRHVLLTVGQCLYVEEGKEGDFSVELPWQFILLCLTNQLYASSNIHLFVIHYICSCVTYGAL